MVHDNSNTSAQEQGKTQHKNQDRNKKETSCIEGNSKLNVTARKPLF